MKLAPRIGERRRAPLFQNIKTWRQTTLRIERRANATQTDPFQRQRRRPINFDFLIKPFN